MKDGLKDIVGKQIARVVVTSSDSAPQQQIFLVFTDGSCFELYGDPEAWLRRAPRVLTTGREEAPYHVPAPESLQSKMERDLKAWNEAKAAIARARRL